MKIRIKFYLFLVLFLTNNLYADYLILNNGNTIKGKIESSNQINTIIINDDTGEKQIIPIQHIQKTIIKPIYIEKLSIHKTDKTIIEAYCVDYNQTSYTMRKELNSSEEIVISLQDILYVGTKLNPINITSEIKESSILLKWSAPHNLINSYKIYHKTNTETEYKLSGVTDKTEYLVEGLTGNTEYTFLIRSITDEGFESLPGKPINITTLNSQPDKPGTIIRKESTANDEIITNWGPSKDSDGTIQGYNIYLKSGSEYKKIASTEKKEYSFNIKNPLTQITLQIKAIDDKNLESEGIESEAFYIQYYDIKADIGYLIPSGELADLFDSGLSGLLSFNVNNYYIYGLSLGMQSGYYTYNSGKKFNNYNYQSYTVIPLIVNTGYKYFLGEKLYLEPSVGFGYSYAELEYKDGNNKTISSNEFTPIIKAGMSISYNIEDFNIGLGVYYSDIIESEANLSSIMINLSYEYMF